MNQAELSTLLQQGLELHRRGAVQEAAARYGEILRSHPTNTDALYLLGAASFQQRRFTEAVQHLAQAVTLMPQRAAAHNLLGLAFKELGRFDDALAGFERAAALEPGAIEFITNRANQLNMLGRFEEAAAAYDRIVELNPGDAMAWFNRGLALHELGRLEDALASVDRALTLNRGNAMAHAQRADILRALHRIEEAIAEYERAIGMQPRLADAHVGHAIALNAAGRREDALASCDEALAASPISAEAHSTRGSILMQSFDAAEQALAAYDQAIALRPDFHIAHSDRGLALHRLDRLPQALASVQQAINRKPTYARGYVNRAIVLEAMGRAGDAIADCEKALALDPKLAGAFSRRATILLRLGRIEAARVDYQRAFALAPNDRDAAFELGVLHLMVGEWSAGWPLYERRSLRAEYHFAALAPQPRWTGEPPNGQPLILLTDQGLGDAIQSARFVPLLAERGHRVRILTAPVLAPLLQSMQGVEAVATSLAELTPGSSAFRWTAMMSLPAIMRTTEETIPRAVPYLAPDPALVAGWSQKLGPAGTKIGIAWQGNPKFPTDKGRSVPLANFAPLARIPGARLISIQKRPGSDQIADVAFGTRIETPLDPGAIDGMALLDTAAVIANLDLLVTSDSMLAHLAGALGCRTLLALRRVPDWRWMLDRSDSPWYPTVRLFRQTSEGEWPDVFRRITDAATPVLSVRST